MRSTFDLSTSDLANEFASQIGSPIVWFFSVSIFLSLTNTLLIFIVIIVRKRDLAGAAKPCGDIQSCQTRLNVQVLSGSMCYFYDVSEQQYFSPKKEN